VHIGTNPAFFIGILKLPPYRHFYNVLLMMHAFQRWHDSMLHGWMVSMFIDFTYMIVDFLINGYTAINPIHTR